MRSVCLVFIVTLLMRSGWAAEEPADLVIIGGEIVTVDENIPQAEALAMRGTRLVRVGSRESVLQLVGDRTKIIELDKEMVMPGFIESHGHLVGMGLAAMSLDLGEAESWEEIVEITAKAVATAEPGAWVLGRGWHQEKWRRSPSTTVDGCPLHTALSKVTPANPVLFTHASGHMAIANAKAMELAGIDATTEDPRGGEILRYESNQPTGVLREKAVSLVSRLSEGYQWSSDRIELAIELAAAECLRKGITSFQDAGSSFDTIDVIFDVARQGRMPLRMWIMVRDSNTNLGAKLLRYLNAKDQGEMVKVGGIKRSLDGALGAHGAWLLEPYDDMPTSAGLNTFPLADLEESARLAMEQDCQLCVHAIGDRANRETLDLFERVLAGDRTRRWRIEHAQHLHPEDIPRFVQLGVIPVMQGIHCTSDAVFVVQRLGLRRAGEGAYVWRRLLDSGARIANGTDAPVEDVDPIASFYASVTRRLSGGTQFFAEQAMTREEALRSYTIDAAYAVFEENERGSLTEGKLADVVVLSKNLLTCPEAEIRAARVEYTIVGGEVVHRRKGFRSRQ